MRGTGRRCRRRAGRRGFAAGRPASGSAACRPGLRGSFRSRQRVSACCRASPLIAGSAGLGAARGRRVSRRPAVRRATGGLSWRGRASRPQRSATPASRAARGGFEAFGAGPLDIWRRPQRGGRRRRASPGSPSLRIGALTSTDLGGVRLLAGRLATVRWQRVASRWTARRAAAPWGNSSLLRQRSSVGLEIPSRRASSLGRRIRVSGCWGCIVTPPVRVGAGQGWCRAAATRARRVCARSVA